MLRKFKNISIPSIGIILVSIILIIFFTMIKIKMNSIEEKRKADTRKKENLVNVITMNLNPKNIKEKMNLLAEAEAWSDFNIPAEVSGIILKKNYNTVFIIN